MYFTYKDNIFDLWIFFKQPILTLLVISTVSIEYNVHNLFPYELWNFQITFLVICEIVFSLATPLLVRTNGHS